MKGVKNEVELAHLRESHLRDAVAMVRFQIELENRLASGEQLTELTVDEILHKYRSADDEFLVESFGTIAAYGGNAAMMHYHATPEDHAVLQRKGFLLVDSGATYLDGTTDITRTYPLGELTEDERLFYTWPLQCTSTSPRPSGWITATAACWTPSPASRCGVTSSTTAAAPATASALWTTSMRAPTL